MREKRDRCLWRARDVLRPLEFGLHREAWLILWCLSLSCVPVVQAYAQEQATRPSASPRIVFVHLRTTPRGGFELVDTRIGSGSLKSPLYNPSSAGLHFELVTGDTGRVLFRNLCSEPTIRRLEYEEPNNPGRLIAKQVVSQTAEFTIRVPYVAGAQRLRFYRPAASNSGQLTIQAKKQELVAAGEVTFVLPAQ